MKNTEDKKSLAKSYEFDNVEEKWLERWTEENSFAAKMEDGKPSFSMVIPPPNVTGVLHVGHALNNTMQDVLVRYHRMCGDNTLWVPGTDHAGIATQNVVERQLATEGKTRHDLGRDAFIERVWEWKKEKGSTIVKQLKRMGASCDWERERFTMDEGLSKAVRESFVRLYKEGLIYKGDYIVNWCPRCLTALADDEVEHEDKKGKLYHIRYPFADGSGHVVVATTRPETMLGDTGVAVHPDDERYSHLADVGIKLPLTDRTIPVVFDHHVEKDFGTGALKVTPAHDRDDYEIGLRHSLEIMKVMDEHGVMNETAGGYAGLDRFKCRKQIVADLKEQGFLEEIEDYDHAVGQCYRCKTVVEPTTSLQWFVSVKPLADKAVSAVRDGRITIYPKTWYNTFYSWMDNIRDWCISRQIWWGHRIPAWSCGDCGELMVETTDPTVCSKCGSANIEQETDVLDTWFSSALWPFSTMGWPEQTKELETFYPTSVLITSFDILFFWVARMMMFGLHFMEDEVPFKDVYLHALVRDKHGKKMSKSTGNVLDPLVVMDQYGTDAMRFTLTAFAAQGREIKLDEDRIEGYRFFINKLWNASRFAMMHVEDCDVAITDVVNNPEDLPLIHQWILSRTARATEGVRRALDEYRFNDAASDIYQFVWHEFCDWYLEWIKPDLFSKDEVLQNQARGVLLHVLETILKLIHPITPFVTEEIWSVLPGDRPLLVTSAFPEVQNWQNEEVEARIGILMGIITGIRNIRAEADVHPSAKIDAFVLCLDTEKLALIEGFSKAISDMTRLDSLTISAESEKPDDAATYIYQDIEMYVPLKGLIDIEKEQEKLGRERKKIEKSLQQINGKLNNKKFLANAPAAIVEKEKGKQVELEAKLAKVEEAEKRLVDIG
ncbi:MAG: valine--tRNA ligase [Desulfocapsa sp.]|nr:MAG: valine--tRNA ligase [Desulfocapsa sp.]